VKRKTVYDVTAEGKNL